jgi:dienelactone hydrolase
MLEYKSGAETAVILVHEIYGVNYHMEAAAGELAAAGYDVFCPDLLGRPSFAYAEEAQAYRYFQDDIGFTRARETVDALAEGLRPGYRVLYLVGYSAGATVAWLGSQAGLYAGVAGYYGSRIRDYKDVRPACPVLLLFPRREAAFDVAGLAAELAAKDRVEALTLDGDHGFADPCGPHYAPQAAAEAFARLAAFLKTCDTGGR